MFKRVVGIVLMGIMALSVLGCGNAPQKSAEPDPAQTVYVQTGTEANKAEEKNKQETPAKPVRKSGIKGKWYSLADAYQEGLLTREDLMHIAYFKSTEYRPDGSVYREGEVWEWHDCEARKNGQYCAHRPDEHMVKLDFTPEMPAPATLDEQVKARLINAYLLNLYYRDAAIFVEMGREVPPIEEYAGCIELVGYYGEYGGHIVAGMYQTYSLGSTAVWYLDIAGIVFGMADGAHRIGVLA